MRSRQWSSNGARQESSDVSEVVVSPPQPIMPWQRGPACNKRRCMNGATKQAQTRSTSLHADADTALVGIRGAAGACVPIMPLTNLRGPAEKGAPGGFRSQNEQRAKPR